MFDRLINRIRRFHLNIRLHRLLQLLVDEALEEVRQQVEAKMQPIRERSAARQRQRVDAATEEAKETVRQLREAVRVRIG